MNLAPTKTVPLLLAGGSAEDRARVAQYDAQLRFLARLESIQWLEGAQPAAAAAVPYPVYDPWAIGAKVPSTP